MILFHLGTGESAVRWMSSFQHHLSSCSRKDDNWTTFGFRRQRPKKTSLTSAGDSGRLLGGEGNQDSCLLFSFQLDYGMSASISSIIRSGVGDLCSCRRIRSVARRYPGKDCSRTSAVNSCSWSR